MLFNDTKLAGIPNKIQKVAARGATLSAPATPATRLGRHSVFGSPMADATPISSDAAVPGLSDSYGQPANIPVSDTATLPGQEVNTDHGSPAIARHVHYQDSSLASGNPHAAAVSSTQIAGAHGAAELVRPPAFGSPVSEAALEQSSRPGNSDSPALSWQQASAFAAQHSPMMASVCTENDEPHAQPTSEHSRPAAVHSQGGGFACQPLSRQQAEAHLAQNLTPAGLAGMPV